MPRAPKIPPHIEAIYNAIMSALEPDLMTTSKVTLGRKLPGETSEQFKERKERYAYAFELYEHFLVSFVKELKQNTAVIRKQKRVAEETASSSADKSKEEEILKSISLF